MYGNVEVIGEWIALVCSHNDIVRPIKKDISNLQLCKAADMLQFLFLFCNTSGSADKVERKEDYIERAFEQVQDLVNKEVAKKKGNEKTSSLLNNLGKRTFQMFPDFTDWSHCGKDTHEL